MVDSLSALALAELLDELGSTSAAGERPVLVSDGAPLAVRTVAGAQVVSAGVVLELGGRRQLELADGRWLYRPRGYSLRPSAAWYRTMHPGGSACTVVVGPDGRASFLVEDADGSLAAVDLTPAEARRLGSLLTSAATYARRLARAEGRARESLRADEGA